MLKVIRESRRFFGIAAGLALLLRLFFVLRFPAVTTDSLIYADIAKNWLGHGVYGITAGGSILPSYIRLPGYPAFLATIFRLFGRDNYRAVLVVQTFVDAGSCFVIADMARRMSGTRASKVAFILAALCPFTANYAAAALTETMEIFFTALALDLALSGLESHGSGKTKIWSACGLATGVAILLRPDGGILLVAVEIVLGWMLWDGFRRRINGFAMLKGVLVVGMFAALPLVPWTVRNLRTMHRFQPLAPRYANDEDEFVPVGFNRWVKTWMADYASVEEIYWQVPDDPIEARNLPRRAYDSSEEKTRTVQLIDEYNSVLHITPAMDSGFAKLAEERVSRSPLRYYVELPALRVVDMWLRPRTELLPADSRWWEFNDDLKGSALALGFGAIGIVYFCAALAGVWRGKPDRCLALLLSFVILRSLFLGTLENPEPRYTLECFPVILVLAAIGLQKERKVSHGLQG